MELRRQGRSQMEFGNEGTKGRFMRRTNTLWAFYVRMNLRKAGLLGGPDSVRAGRYRGDFEYRVSVRARRGPDGAGPSRKVHPFESSSTPKIRKADPSLRMTGAWLMIRRDHFLRLWCFLICYRWEFVPKPSAIMAALSLSPTIFCVLALGCQSAPSPLATKS